MHWEAAHILDDEVARLGLADEGHGSQDRKERDGGELHLVSAVVVCVSAKSSLVWYCNVERVV